MLSKDGYLGAAAAGPWYPHVMLYGPPVAGSEWGADVAGSPVFSSPSDLLPLTLFFVSLRKGPDGTLVQYSHQDGLRIRILLVEMTSPLKNDAHWE